MGLAEAVVRAWYGLGGGMGAGFVGARYRPWEGVGKGLAEAPELRGAQCRRQILAMQEPPYRHAPSTPQNAMTLPTYGATHDGLQGEPLVTAAQLEKSQWALWGAPQPAAATAQRRTGQAALPWEAGVRRRCPGRAGAGMHPKGRDLRGAPRSG